MAEYGANADYGDSNYKDDEALGLHYKALRKLVPLSGAPLDEPFGAFDDDLVIEGTFLDDEYENEINNLAIQFPDGDVVGGEMWDGWVRITGKQTIADIVKVLYGVANNAGWMRPVNLIAIGTSYGKTGCNIVENDLTDFFLAGNFNTIPVGSVLPHQCMELEGLWTFIYYYDGPQDSTFEAYISSQAPAFAKINFTVT